MIKKVSDFLIVNGVKFPSPSPGMEIIHSINVDSGRNLNGTVVGQVVGRPIWKINNLSWGGLTASQWAEMKKALEPFYVKVTFSGDDGNRHTVTMYPGDKNSKPLFLNGIEYENYETCKFNLIDCGIIGED